MKTERHLRPSERPADDQTDQIDDAESSADVGEHSRATNSDDLDAFCASELYQPLRMSNTGFRPATNLLSRIAPTT